ncbi:MAG: phosphatase PAP2 family protein [Cytophagaceae bacterium]|nr:phosphatase PAP2 family protein [Cytophagaceae bacterium]
MHLIKITLQEIAKRKYFYIPFILMVIIGGAQVIFYKKGPEVILLDRFNNSFLDYFFNIYTYLGSFWANLVFIIVLLFIRFDLAITGFLCSSVNGIAGRILQREIFLSKPRPGDFFTDPGALTIFKEIDLNSLGSFPSGHTVTAFTIFCFFALITESNIVHLSFFILALLVGVSRIYLAQHFFNDIYFGAILATVITTVIFFTAWHFLKYKNPSWASRSLRNL